MRISDWSSDVCSSDLLRSTPNMLETDAGSPGRPGTRPGILRRGRAEILAEDHAEGGDAFIADFIRDARHRFAHPQPRAGRFEPRLLAPDRAAQQLGRASWGERVCRDVEDSVVALS